MVPKDRKQFGRAGRTTDEFVQAKAAREEIHMHHQFIGWLHRNRLYQYIHANPNKKSPLPAGWPDFTIFGPIEKVLFLEFKTEHGVISPAQRSVTAALAIWGHTIYITTSYQEAVELTVEHFNL